jgi:hypothetical protein
MGDVSPQKSMYGETNKEACYANPIFSIFKPFPFIFEWVECPILVYFCMNFNKTYNMQINPHIARSEESEYSL